MAAQRSVRDGSRLISNPLKVGVTDHGSIIAAMGNRYKFTFEQILDLPMSMLSMYSEWDDYYTRLELYIRSMSVI